MLQLAIRKVGIRMVNMGQRATRRFAIGEVVVTREEKFRNESITLGPTLKGILIGAFRMPHCQPKSTC